MGASFPLSPKNETQIKKLPINATQRLSYLEGDPVWGLDKASTVLLRSMLAIYLYKSVSLSLRWKIHLIGVFKLTTFSALAEYHQGFFLRAVLILLNFMETTENVSVQKQSLTAATSFNMLPQECYCLKIYLLLHCDNYAAC